MFSSIDNVEVFQAPLGKTVSISKAREILTRHCVLSEVDESGQLWALERYSDAPSVWVSIDREVCRQYAVGCGRVRMSVLKKWLGY